MQTWTWKEFISHQEPIQNNLINSSQLKNYIYIYIYVRVCVFVMFPLTVHSLFGGSTG
jgi:hypothetical protein